MMFGKRSRKDRKQARKQQESKRRRLARLMSRAPRVESLEARQLLTAVSAVEDGVADQFVVRNNATTGSVEVFVNGQLAGTDPTVVNGSGDSDTLIVDGINGVPNISLQYNGAGGVVDSLEFVNIPTGADASYVTAPPSTPDGKDGLTSVTDGVDTVSVNFTGLEPIGLIGAGGSLTVDATSTPATTTLNVADAGPPGDGVNEITGDGGFETTTFSGFASLTLRGGDGSETITLASLDDADPDGGGAGAALTSVTLDGDNTGGTDTGDDLIIVEAVPAAVTVTVNGGAGNDVISIGSPASSLDPILGNVIIAGEDHNAMPETMGMVSAKGNSVMFSGSSGDVLIVDDAGDGDASTWDIDDGSVMRSGAGTVTYGTIETLFINTGSGADDINVLDTTDGIVTDIGDFGGSDDIDVTTTGDGSFTIINAGTGDDVIDIANTGAGSVTIADGESGMEPITLASSGAGSGVGLFGGINGDAITVNGTGGGGAVVEIQGGDDPDTIDINATAAGSFTDAFGGLGDDTITVDGADPNSLDGILGAVCVFGGDDMDVLTVNDEDDFNDNTYHVNPNDVTRMEVGGGSPDVVIGYDEVETLNLLAGEGEDKIIFNESDAPDVFINGNLPTGVAGDPNGDQLVITARLTVEPERNKTTSAFVTAGAAIQPPGPTNVVFIDMEHVVWQDRYEMNDVFDPANDIDQSYDLGSEPEVIEADLSIHSDTDVDFFSWTANVTGKAIINSLFNHALGDLQMNVRDNAGNIIASADTATDNEQIVIPVVSQELYIIEILAVPNADPAICNANTYSLEIENFAAPQPEVDLVDASDTGMMLNDDYTADDTPTIEVQADLSAWLMGIGVDQGTGTEGVEVVISATHFDTGAVTTVVADRVDPLTPNNNLWQGTLPDLDDGQYFIEAWIRVEDDQTAPAVGRSILSEPLPITIDTAAPAAASFTLAPGSNSGSKTDINTNITTPTFNGSAEANAKIRLYANDGFTGRSLVGTSFVGSDTSDGAADGLGLFEVTTAGDLSYNDYTFDIEVEDLAGNVTTFGDEDVVIDPYEFNDTNATATQLGSPETVTLNDVVNHGDNAPNPDGGDIDVFAYTAHSTGKLIVSMIPQGANGNLDIQVQDFGGLNIIASNNDIGLAESVVLPVVAGETYYIRAFSVPQEGAFNFQLYDLEIENFAAPVPSDVTLDPNDDSGMMNNDLITQVDDARLFVKADLADFAAMGIPILDSADVNAGNVAGAAVEVFINGQSVGYADPFLGLTTLFEIELDSVLVGPWATNIPITTGTAVAPDNAGYFNIVQAAVRIFDGQNVNATGRSLMSPELDVHYDPNTPDAGLATIDMLDASDTGFDITDNVTGKMSPAFQGVAEENTKIRLYADLNQDGNPELIGQTVTGSDSSDVGIFGPAATDTDGLGLWEITVEPLQDGVYDITIEIEDVAGNSSDQADGSSLVAVIDTLPPQRPTVDLVGMDVQDALDEYDFTSGALVITPDLDPVNSDTGLSTHDDITRGLNPQNPGGQGDTDVLLRVSAEPGTQVDIKDGETIIATFTMPNEEFVFVRLTLDEDPHPISAEATDQAGNRSAQSEELLVTVDVTPPIAAAQTDLIESSDTFDDFQGIAGPQWSATDNVTAINRPAFFGLAEKNTIVRIYAIDTVTMTPQLIGEGLVGSDESDGVESNDNGLGIYEITVEPLADGVYDIIVQLEDLAGNQSAVSQALTVTVDTLAPQRPTVDLYDFDDTGRNDMDNTTISDPLFNDGEVHVRYSAELDQRVIIKDGETVVDDFIFNAAEDATDGGATDLFGERFIDFVANAAAFGIPAEGAHPISVEVFDVAGNRSAQSEELLITIDFTPPAAPSTPDLNASSDSGMFNDDNVTSIQEAHFVGTAEANSNIRIYATPTAGALPAGVLGVPQLVGEGVVRSDESDGDGTDGLGVWEVTIEPLEDAVYTITAEVEDKAGNISAISSGLTIEIDTYQPNTPFLDLVEASDSGRHDDDNVTNDTTPTFTMTTHDPNFADHIADIQRNNSTDYLKYRIYDRPEEGVEVLLYASATDAAEDAINTAGDMFTSSTLITETVALAEGWHNLKLEVEDRAGNISEDFLLNVLVDATPFKGDIDLHPESDSGVWGYPATMTDRITSDKVPDFFGVAEANNIVTLTIDGNILAGTTVAVPLDGDDAFQPQNAPYNNVEANWGAETVQNLADGQHSIVATFEDLAGNQIDSDALLFFVDTVGPRVTNVQVNSVLNDYDLFDPKPSVDGPTPRVDSLVISVSDLPARTAAFLYDPIFAPLALEAGHYSLVGDDVGIIPIADIDYNTDLNIGDPAASTITLTFFDPLPDDRYTLTLSDSLTDIAGNSLDGESNAAEPQEMPNLPSGDGVHGGDFVARFTIDSRAEIAVWSQGVVYVDTNGNFVWDPDAEDNDHTNRDFVYNFGEITDAYFAGNFSDTDDSSGFDKIGAYGRVNGVYQFFLDTDDDGVGDLVPNMFYQVNAIPVAGNFFQSVADDAAILDGDRPRDEIGAYDGNNWYLDTNGNNNIENGELLPTNMRGVPFVGDFNGDGFDDLATYDNQTGIFQFDTNRDGVADDSMLFGFHGFGEKPVTGDVNLDGVDDIVMWVPGQEGVLPKESGEFHFLVSDTPVAPATLPRHFFEVVPGFNLNSPNPAPAAFSPDPLGNDLIAQFGDEFALPIIGNFDPPVASSGGGSLEGLLTNDVNPLDTNRDGFVTGLDALIVINALGQVDFDPTVNPLRLLASVGGDKLDASGDGTISSGDALYVINGLVQEALGGGEGELVGEQSQANWSDAVAGAIADLGDDDDDLLELLAADDQRTF